MHRNALVLGLLLSCFSGSLWGQHAVDPAIRYHRIIALVHLAGSGKNNDRIVPEYVPAATAAALASHAQAAGNGPSSGAAPTAPASTPPTIIAWGMQLSDDGKMAIVHMVAVDRHAFDAILADTRPEIRVFEIGKDSREDIEKELKKYKKDFNLDSLRVLAQQGRDRPEFRGK